MTIELISNSQTKPRREATLLGAMAVVSIVYGLVLLLVFTNLVHSPTKCAGFWFFCLEPNAIGDLLAGIFAPLAFLWLVTAVLVQSQELQEQRKELELTRDEMRLQRGEFEQSRLVAIESKGVAEAQAKAADAQAEAAIKNAVAAETQNKILEEQLEAQRRDARDQEFSAFLNQLNTTFAKRINKATFISDARNNGYRLLGVAEVPSDRDQALVEFCNYLIARHPSTRKVVEENGYKYITTERKLTLQHLSDILRSAADVGAISRPNQLLLKTLRIEQVQRIVDYFLAFEEIGGD